MAFKTPQEIAEATVQCGTAKARLPWHKAFVSGILAGAYIAFGALLCVMVSAGMDPTTWGGFPRFLGGAVFSVGLILTVLAGAELLTGNMMVLPVAVLARAVKPRALAWNWTVVLVGNFVGSVIVAYFLATASGILTSGPAEVQIAAIGQAKGDLGLWEAFLRGVGANWLVALAVWLAIGADDFSGKILGIFFPIMAFVAIGFEHSVANMFLLPAAVFATGVIGWYDVLHNLIPVLVGNVVGAGLFVATAYWYLYLRVPAPAAQAQPPVTREPVEVREPVQPAA